ncbi:hypothetical protein PM3016_1963 [Paenibacillus mucilaginosus 3016]|uniref:Uncharacterized protein n=2 Tax=Paenibacillus mucilaginosus TaxID=61624 RepID=H6NA21_9BACL|nr:hypothetical protein PM3016_1963 [Paenibacillus mucilaginosus 3016]WFA17622.1 hypothetical protein ERY13_10200 [Paenibacillus mucilaginosus]
MDSGGRAPRELTYRDGWRRGRISPASQGSLPDPAGHGDKGPTGMPGSLLWRSPHSGLPRCIPMLLFLLPAAVFAGFLWLVYLLARMA